MPLTDHLSPLPADPPRREDILRLDRLPPEPPAFANPSPLPPDLGIAARHQAARPDQRAEQPAGAEPDVMS